MAGVNSVHLVGRLGRDPELKYTPSNMAVAEVGIACDERRKKNDEWVDHTEWVNLTFFGKNAENLCRYCKKGKQLFIDGRIQTGSWDDKDTGKKRYATKVVVNRFVMLGSKSDEGSRDAGGEDWSKGGEDKGAQSADSEPKGREFEDEEDESLPF